LPSVEVFVVPPSERISIEQWEHSVPLEYFTFPESDPPAQAEPANATTTAKPHITILIPSPPFFDTPLWIPLLRRFLKKPSDLRISEARCI
jgi:hypothetical protein